MDNLSQSAAGLAIDDEPEKDIAAQTPPPEEEARVKAGNKRLTNISEPFRSASRALQPGQLVKDEHFTLFESIGALEIMDPKMDSGCLQSGETLYDDYEVLHEPLPEEVLWIVDRLLCYEMAWHQGYPLSQTLFTSQHIENLLWPERKAFVDIDFHDDLGKTPDYEQCPMLFILKAYCLATIKSCDLTIKSVTSSQYYEEEDFSTQTYNRDLLSRHPTKDICDVLLIAEGIASHRLLSDLSSRIRIRLDLLILLEQEPMPDYIKDNALLADVDNDYASLTDSHVRGIGVPSAFSQKLQRKLTSTVPPRPIVELSYGAALSELKRLRQELHNATGIQTLLQATSPTDLETFLLSFSASQPGPLPLPRSRVSSAVMNQADEWFIELLKQELTLTVLPDSETLDPVNWTLEAPINSVSHPNPRYELARILDVFVTKALPDFGGYLDFWRAMTSNRCRLRRLLTHVMVGLDDVQRVADELDPQIESLVASPQDLLPEALYHWASHHKSRVSAWVVQLGFELDMYLPEELAGMYWLLSTISKRHGAMLQSMLEFHAARLKGRTYLGQGVPGQQKQIDQCITYLQTQILLAQANESLAEALYSIYTYLHYLGIIRSQEAAQSDDEAELRYELRMKPFLTLQERYIELYPEYDRALHPFGSYKQPQDDVYEDAKLSGICDIVEMCIQVARQSYTKLKQMGHRAAAVSIMGEEYDANISACLTSAVAARLFTTQLRSAVNAKKYQLAQTMQLSIAEPGKRYHDWWIIPKLVDKAI